MMIDEVLQNSNSNKVFHDLKGTKYKFKTDDQNRRYAKPNQSIAQSFPITIPSVRESALV